MAEEAKPAKYLEDVVLYQYADVARKLLSNEETAMFASGGLEKMVGDFEKILGDNKGILDGFKAGALGSKEGTETAINIYAGKYQNALGKMNVSEFYNLRLKILTSILGEEKAEEAKAVFEKYGEQTVGSIMKKIKQAEAKLNDETGLFDEKAKEEATKTIQKLVPIHTLIHLLEQRNYEELMPGATKSIYKKLIADALQKA